jgi:FKBP-type peptidyl-prolyl cis-trans isomerase
MNLNRLSLFTLLIILLSSHSCKENTSKKTETLTDQEIRDKLIEFNKNKVKAEDEIISDYVMENYPDAQTTSTGIRYQIYSISDAPKLQNEEVAIVDYRIHLLGGEEIYSTKESGPEKIRIGHEDVPAGVHESLLLMAPGDSAIFVMPSYRAYGFTGEAGNVPQNAILIYHIDLIDRE